MPSIVTHSSTISSSQDTDIESLLRSDYTQLTDVDDIQECLRLLDEEETQIDADLDELLNSRLVLEEELDRLDVLRPSIGTMRDNASKLLGPIGDTSKLAEKISEKVRVLDLEQSRVKECIKLVDDVRELKTCISGLQQAMAEKDYETASMCVQRARQIDPIVTEGSFAEITVPSSMNPEPPAKILQDASTTLFELYSHEFDVAVHARNEASLTRFFKLFPLIGQHTAGLDKYSTFVCGIIAKKCQEQLGGSQRGPMFYSEVLTSLFESVALLIDHHHPIVEKHYGAGRMLRVMQRIEEEVDVQSRLVLDSFVDERQLQRKINEINNENSLQRRIGSVRRPAPVESQMDPRELEVNLNELTMVSQKTHLFYRFMNSRTKEEMKLLQENGYANEFWADRKSDLYNDWGLLKVSGLSRKVQELMNDYLIIEEFYMRKMIEKAVKMDPMDEFDSDTHTSTSVDDIFYLVRKSLHRVLRTSDAQLLGAMVNLVNRTLEVDYVGVFQKRMMSIFVTGGEGGDPRVHYMIILNNLGVSVDYVGRLIEEIGEYVQASGMLREEKMEEKEMETGQGLNASSAKFKQILQSGIEQLFGQTIKPRLRPLFQEAYREVKYVLEEDEFHEADLSDVFVHRFRAGFSSLIAVYKETLTPQNFMKLMQHVLDALTKHWEKIIFQSRFNPLGAIRLDKDIRAITQFLSQMTEWPSRDRFTRLTQISVLLNLETLEEIYDYWGQGGKGSWRLTVGEVKKVLALRNDFYQEAINKLKL
ncbi:uncharacterized protein VTP21DRAFT_5972 [Calcarisporiella thermophila]|uniref:uncharacterized protein n=1 Tax=Calcarisporiella thermophila TaxID=911321 RepID=UPI0037447419